MLNKLKKYNWQILTDTRVLGLIAFGIIAVLVTWSGVKSIQTNYDLQKQISKLNQENNVKRLENTNLELRNEYYKSDQFLELAARRQFGKAAPGETLINVPKNVALSYTTQIKAEENKIESKSNKPKYQQNIEAWFKFFLHQEEK